MSVPTTVRLGPTTTTKISSGTIFEFGPNSNSEMVSEFVGDVSLYKSLIGI